MAAPTLFEQVWAVARLVPAGRVVAYGDIAALLGRSPRMVGRAMALCDDPAVPWWRITSAAGRLPDDLLARALPHWRDERTPVRADRAGVRMADARADLAMLGDAAERVLGPLPGLS